MSRMDTATRCQIIACLIEGNSIRATSRLTGVAINTVIKLAIDAGTACADYQDRVLRNLQCERVQADEIWSFVGAKQKNVTEDNGAIGDVWTWVALDADSKLACSWWVGKRDWETATAFVNDLQERLANRIQLTTDGLKLYFHAVTYAFQGDIDYAILHKMYGGGNVGEGRYSPAVCTGCEKKAKIGDPDPKHISTSYVERLNLTMRMSMRRFTRLTNAFSKKFENHVHAVALYFMWYNFGRVHQTLKMTPARKAGVETCKWEIVDIVNMINAYQESKKSN
jgi:IS1 family transposase